jgi:hypothetical protein
MRHKLIGAILLCIAPLLLFAQYKNNIWLLGYANNFSGAPWNGSKLVFNPTGIDTSYDERSMVLGGCYSGLKCHQMIVGLSIPMVLRCVIKTTILWLTVLI